MINLNDEHVDWPEIFNEGMTQTQTEGMDISEVKALYSIMQNHGLAQLIWMSAKVGLLGCCGDSVMREFLLAGGTLSDALNEGAE